MNPSQYYPYQLAVSASIPGLPAGFPPTIVHQNMQPHLHAQAGIRLNLPRHPPPTNEVISGPPVVSVPNAAQDSTTATITEIHSDDADESTNNEDKDEVKAKPSVESDVKTIAAHSTYSKQSTQPLTQSGTTTTAVAGTVPTPMVTPPNPTNGLVGGVYAGAYIQQTIPQTQIGGASHHQPQIMAMATAGLQHTLPGQPASKYMYLPQGPAVQANPYAMQPTLVMDYTGKTYIMNQPAPVQYQMQAHTGLKAPHGHQYMLAPQTPQLYTTLQSQAASLQGAPVARYPVPTGYTVPGTVPGVSTVPPVANQPLYYYYT